MIKVSDLSIPTLDDVNAFNKKILLRIDINSPVDKKTGKLLDDSRIKAHAYTVKNLLERDNAIVILSHQGRPGDDDFISLQQHAELLSKYIGTNVEFIEDIIGPYAIEKVKKIEKGQIYLLENVRLVSEELIEAPPAQQAKTFLVRKLSPLFDIYVNDAFAAAHRSQPSLVGFPIVLPSAAGQSNGKRSFSIS
jgi:phosphoglycerate kinase (EC 2.7.2.3)